MNRTTKLVSLVFLAIGVLICAGLYSEARAASTGILDSYHNLNPDYTPSVTPARKLTGDYKEICVYCHTPHGGDPTSGPLWNRDTTGGAVSYTMYSSPTFDATIDPAPTGVSKACLSCHDGSVSINALINRPGSGSGSGGTVTKFPTDPALRANNQSLLGTDLSNDHPVSMDFLSAKSPGLGGTIGENTHGSGFRSVASGYVDGTDAASAPATGVKLPLYDGKVQCASCHDPHETRTKIAQDGTGAGQVFFLRVSNVNSELCRTCHLK